MIRLCKQGVVALPACAPELIDILPSRIDDMQVSVGIFGTWSCRGRIFWHLQRGYNVPVDADYDLRIGGFRGVDGMAPLCRVDVAAHRLIL